MKKILLVVLLTAFALTASAQNPHEKTMQLLNLMQSDKVTDATTGNMMKLFSSMGVGLPDDKVTKEYMAYVSTELKAFSQKTKEEMVPLYENYFTPHEIQKYIDFYTTPEGKKLLESQPVIQQQLMTTMMTKDFPELQSKFQKKLEELKGKN